MRIQYGQVASVTEVGKYSDGVKPIYGNVGSTSRGVVHCTCGRCVGDLLYGGGLVVGWFDTVCTCGNKIDWSDAEVSL